MAEAGFDELEEAVQQGRGDGGRVVQVNAYDGRIDLGGRVEGVGGDVGGDGGLAIHLHAERQQAEVAGEGADALGHLALHGQDQALRGALGLQQVAQQGRGDVIGDVGDHQVARGGHQLGRVEDEDISLHQAHIGHAAQHFFQRAEQVGIQLHGDHLAGGGSQVAGQAAQAGADLEHIVLGEDLGGHDDAAQGGLVQQEILAQALVGAQVVTAQQAGHVEGAGGREGRARWPDAGGVQGMIHTMFAGAGQRK